MRIYLDDQRESPEGWVRAKTAPEAIALLAAGGVTHLSLDHDLGEEPGVGTGYDVVTWLEEQVALHGFTPPELDVHSSNAGARPKMEAGIAAIQRFARANAVTLTLKAARLRVELTEERRRSHSRVLREHRVVRRLRCRCLWQRGRLVCTRIASVGTVVECTCGATWVLK